MVSCIGVSLPVTFYLGTYPSMISKAVKSCRRTNQPLIEGMISGIRRPQIIFAPSPQSKTNFLT